MKALKQKIKKMDIVVKKSAISGRGVFAARDFKRGEIVLRWQPKLLDAKQIKELSDQEKIYVSQCGNKFYLMQPPECYVNHSCEANTYAKNGCDVAKRFIIKGEEITADYTQEGIMNSFRCYCGSKKCQKIIK